MSVKDYYERYWERERPSFALDPLAHRRLELLREHIAGKQLHVLDAGCGYGEFVAALAGDGHDAVGLELSETAMELAREAHPGLTVVAHSVEDLPWPVAPASFDLVWSFEVVEHLLEPRKLFKGAFDALRPGGVFALTTPFHGRVKNLVLALHGFERHFAVEGDHIRFFTDAAIRDLGESVGFSVDGFAHFGRFAPLSAGVFVWMHKP